MPDQKIQRVLEKLVALYNEWGLSINDWILVGEWGLKLQGYNVRERKTYLGTDIVDTIVDKDKLPWQTIEPTTTPPRDSKELCDYIKFMETTGFGLDIHIGSQSMLKGETITYELPNKSKIRIYTPLEEVSVHQELFYKYGEGVGKEEVDRWLGYIEEIKGESIKKKDTKIVKACEKVLSKS